MQGVRIECVQVYGAGQPAEIERLVVLPIKTVLRRRAPMGLRHRRRRSGYGHHQERQCGKEAAHGGSR